MIFLAPAHSYLLPVPDSIAASLAIDQCQMHVRNNIAVPLLDVSRNGHSASLRSATMAFFRSCNVIALPNRIGMWRGREPAVFHRLN
jgi:hypothetical protein